MAYKSISYHLVSLVVNHFPHLGPCAVWRVRDGVLVRVLKMRAVLNEAGFPVISIMFREGFFMLIDKEVCKLGFVRAGVSCNIGEVNFKRFCSRRDVKIRCRPFNDAYWPQSVGGWVG